MRNSTQNRKIRREVASKVVVGSELFFVTNYILLNYHGYLNIKIFRATEKLRNSLTHPKHIDIKVKTPISQHLK